MTLSWKNDVNVFLKSKKKKKLFLVGFLKIKDENTIRIHWSEALIRIRTKISQIHNTAGYTDIFVNRQYRTEGISEE
jgi:hypothetical protein